jgi:hypothetical protein
MPGATAPVVARGEHAVGIRGVDADVDEAGVGIDVVLALPGLATVLAAVEPALLVGAVERARGGDEDDLRVRRVHRDAADVIGARETDVGEGLAAVGRLVDAVAEVRAALVVRLTGADIERVGCRRRDRDVADREGLLVGEERAEARALVLGLPDAARRARDVPDRTVAGIDVDVDDATRVVHRSDLTPRGRGEDLLGEQRAVLLRAQRRGEDERKEGEDGAAGRDRRREGRVHRDGLLRDHWREGGRVTDSAKGWLAPPGSSRTRIGTDQLRSPSVRRAA